MNVYEEAHNLARAIKESNEFKEYDRLKTSVESDEQLNQMLQEFQSLQLRFQTAQLSGESMDPELMNRIQQMSAMLMTKPAAAEYLQAAMRFTVMMNDVMQILAEAAKLNIPL